MLASLPQPAKRPASASSEANTQTALILFISCSFWGTVPASPAYYRFAAAYEMNRTGGHHGSSWYGKTAVSSRKFIQKFV
jgi:hypothetical protein